MSSAIVLPRAAKRVRVLMNGTLFTRDGVRKVRVRDLSSSGARVAADTDIPSDCDAVFRMGSMFAAARVAWAEGRNAGLHFYRELPSEQVLSVTGPEAEDRS